MKKLLMNEENYLEKIIKKAKQDKNSKIFSYDFNLLIRLIIKRDCLEYELTNEEIAIIKEKAKNAFSHHMNYEKEDKKTKQFPKRSYEEIYEDKYNEYISKKDVEAIYEKVVLTMNEISHKFNEDEWKTYIENNIRTQLKIKKDFKKIDKLYFSKNDLDILNTVKKDDNGNNLELTTDEKRLMFTYMMLAKYYNEDNPLKVNIGLSVNDVFNYANMGSRKKEQKVYMINKLQKLGLLDISINFFKDKREVKYRLLKCDISNEDNDNIFYISANSNQDEELMDIGKKCKDMFKLFKNDKFKQCERCGELVEKHGRRDMYCSFCKKQRQKEWNINYNKKRL